MSAEKNKSENDPNKAEEPEAAYGTKKITFFDSVEEMNEHQYRQYAKMTPEERLQTVCKMRKAVWPEKSMKKPFARHIHIKK